MDKTLKRVGKLGWQTTTAIEDFGARMCNIDTKYPSGIPIEFIDIEINVS